MAAAALCRLLQLRRRGDGGDEGDEASDRSEEEGAAGGRLSTSSSPPSAKRQGLLQPRLKKALTGASLTDQCECLEEADTPGGSASRAALPRAEVQPSRASWLSGVRAVFSRRRHATFFDWDDTLFCTSHWLAGHELVSYGARNVRLRQLAASARQLLEMALAAGPTFIVTNARQGWVEECAASFMPELLPLLPRLQVVSARSKFEHLYPEQPSEWKVQALLELEGPLRGAARAVLALGDAPHDLEAAEALAARLGAAVKTVKLCDEPDLESLGSQQLRLLRALPGILAHRGDLDVHIAR